MLTVTSLTICSGSKSERWSEIGFQGKDPQTDFRGTGFLVR